MPKHPKAQIKLPGERKSRSQRRPYWPRQSRKAQLETEEQTASDEKSESGNPLLPRFDRATPFWPEGHGEAISLPDWPAPGGGNRRSGRSRHAAHHCSPGFEERPSGVFPHSPRISSGRPHARQKQPGDEEIHAAAFWQDQASSAVPRGNSIRSSEGSERCPLPACSRMT